MLVGRRRGCLRPSADSRPENGGAALIIVAFLVMDRRAEEVVLFAAFAVPKCG